MKKGQSTGVVVLCVLLFLAVIAIAIYMVIDFKDLIESPTNLKSQVKYQDSTKDLVYSYEKDVEGVDGTALTFKLPYVNILSSYADEINKNISNMSLSIYVNFEYYVYLNDNILSLVVEGTVYANGSRVYSVYNIDIYTGERIYNEDILEYLGITEEEYIAKLPAAYHNAFLEKFPNISDIYEDYTKSEEYKNTIADSNCTIDTPMYMGLNKALKVIGKIYSPAGPSYYNEIVNVM